MTDLYTIRLENNKIYHIIDTIINNINRYLILANDTDDLAIRKVITHDNEEYVTKLDNEEEYDLVISLFHQKHKEG